MKRHDDGEPEYIRSVTNAVLGALVAKGNKWRRPNDTCTGWWWSHALAEFQCILLCTMIMRCRSFFDAYDGSVGRNGSVPAYWQHASKPIDAQSYSYGLPHVHTIISLQSCWPVCCYRPEKLRAQCECVCYSLWCLSLRFSLQINGLSKFCNI